MARNADPRANDAASPDRLASADKGSARSDDKPRHRPRRPPKRMAANHNNLARSSKCAPARRGYGLTPCGRRGAGRP